MSDKFNRFNLKTTKEISCVRCKHGEERKAYFIYHGDSVCRECYDEIIKFEKCNNKIIGYQP